MSEELIINELNWLDPRMEGLKCWFSHVGCLAVKGEFRGTQTDQFDTVCFYKDNESLAYDFCRLAQGDKTEYDGKGQPVPDGVRVNAWYYNSDSACRYPHNGLSQCMPWSAITHYQVQEQPAQYDEHFNHLLQDDVIISPQTRDEIVACLPMLEDLTCFDTMPDEYVEKLTTLS